MKYFENKFAKIVWKKYALHMIKTIPNILTASVKNRLIGKCSKRVETFLSHLPWGGGRGGS